MKDTRVNLDSRQLNDLRGIVDGRISTNESVLDQHGHDESAFTPARPSAVVMVNSTEEVSRILAYCNAEQIPVVPFGAGTSLDGHVVPILGGVSLDLTNMNRILEIRQDDLVARVQAGVTRVALNEKLSDHGLFFRLIPEQTQLWAEWRRLEPLERQPPVMGP